MLLWLLLLLLLLLSREQSSPLPLCFGGSNFKPSNFLQGRPTDLHIRVQILLGAATCRCCLFPPPLALNSSQGSS